ncbi:MAG: putative dual specificity protein phosphatase 1B-like isoform X1 [Harvfovirus sp.]|uniref:Putative dual specificity protein phosphatase 1B-like isoform X1 n=1 Tax=Harvfovirus sp. TaxID=2487768 RepID=A0A3G5A6I6_9VIRU|nr:MAG: putative dual specificity protein phosphatase 1B-like isoform X1 [Harvfovirus sp.]
MSEDIWDLADFFTQSCNPAVREVETKMVIHKFTIENEIDEVAALLDSKSDFGSHATKITDFLFLSGATPAVTDAFLRVCDIRHIITLIDLNNVIKSVRRTTKRLQIRHTSIKIVDVGTESLTEAFAVVFPILQAAEENKKAVLIHCAMGISRSASMVIMFLMKSRNWRFDQTLAYVENLRKQVNPNKGFKDQMIQFEKQLLN